MALRLALSKEDTALDIPARPLKFYLVSPRDSHVRGAELNADLLCFVSGITYNVIMLSCIIVTSIEQ